MYTLIVIFYVSFLCILVMLLLKGREAKTGHPNLISRLGRGTDAYFHVVFTKIGETISYVNRHTFIALAHWIAIHVLTHIRKIYVEIKHRFITHPHGKKVMDAVRGRAELSDTGASAYLKRIGGQEDDSK